MKRILLKLSVALVIAVGVAAAATAYAFRGGPHQMMKRHMAAVFGEALDAVKATPDQRTRLEAIKDRTEQQLMGLHVDRGGHLAEAAQLFEADKIDSSRVAELKSERTAQMRKAGDIVVAAVTEAHDVLSPAQRQQLADFVKARRAEHAGWRGGMMKHMVSGRIDDALDTVSASAEQRTAILAARDHVFESFAANHPTDGGAELDKALALFVADKIDGAQVTAIRADHEARMQKTADAVTQAIYDVHDALTAAQRKTLVEHIRAKVQQHHGRRGHHGPGPGPGTGAANEEG